MYHRSIRYHYTMLYIVHDMADNENPDEDDEEEIDDIVEKTLSTILSNKRIDVRQMGPNISARFYICPFCSNIDINCIHAFI